jgi:hypothetical protein
MIFFNLSIVRHLLVLCMTCDARNYFVAQATKTSLRNGNATSQGPQVTQLGYSALRQMLAKVARWGGTYPVASDLTQGSQVMQVKKKSLLRQVWCKWRNKQRKGLIYAARNTSQHCTWFNVQQDVQHSLNTVESIHYMLAYTNCNPAAPFYIGYEISSWYWEEVY